MNKDEIKKLALSRQKKSVTVESMGCSVILKEPSVSVMAKVNEIEDDMLSMKVLIHHMVRDNADAKVFDQADIDRLPSPVFVELSNLAGDWLTEAAKKYPGASLDEE